MFMTKILTMSVLVFALQSQAQVVAADSPAKQNSALVVNSVSFKDQAASVPNIFLLGPSYQQFVLKVKSMCTGFSRRYVRIGYIQNPSSNVFNISDKATTWIEGYLPTAMECTHFAEMLYSASPSHPAQINIGMTSSSSQNININNMAFQLNAGWQLF